MPRQIAQTRFGPPPVASTGLVERLMTLNSQYRAFRQFKAMDDHMLSDIGLDADRRDRMSFRDFIGP